MESDKVMFDTQAKKEVNIKKIDRSMPNLLTNPTLGPWDSTVEKEKNEYRRTQFKKRNPQLEQEKFLKVVDAFADYKQTMNLNWNGNGKRKEFF